MATPYQLTTRRRDFDAVRELIVASLIFFHTARIFDDMGFYVKNEPQERAVTFVVIVVALWGMPLLFSIAGFAVWHSLQQRTVIEFVRERLQRLLIPFIVGLLLLAPPQTHFQLAADPAYQESYAQFYPRFFDVSFSFDFPAFFAASPETGLFHSSHFWFLYDLLLFTLLLLPGFLYLRQPAGQRVIERFVRLVAGPWAIFLLALPVAVIEAGFGTDISGGWNHAGYMVFILFGYLIAADARFGRVLGENRKRAVVLAIAATAGGLAGFALHAESGQGDPLYAYDFGSVMLRFVKAFSGWCWIVAIFGYIEHARQMRQANRRLPEEVEETHETTDGWGFMKRVERYARQAVLPFYLLHQTVIVVIGFYVVPLQHSAPVKFLIISLASLVLTLLLYEYLVKRTRLTRFLFGMRPSRTA